MTTTQQWNARYPIGTPVIAYPDFRPEDDPQAERLVTRTRSRAELLGGHTPVVWIERHDSCIALTHLDLVESDSDRYMIGRDGVFATLYDRQEQRLVVENATEAHCRKVRDRLLAAVATPGTDNGGAA